ncbi:hypothetical protein AFLA_013886 [Aspergillus flavus NRRL3357]|nr:hypothetical protein AFLA_013886 [Aspergillus flavus NRRL3357]
MSQSKPSIIIVPGSFSLPEFYDAVTDRVASKGYEIKAIRLRSTEKLQQPATMYDDAAAIASEVAALVDQGKEVILVVHSYGGVPASESIKGLAKTEDSGKAGGIVNLAYLTAVVPELGASSADVLADIPTENRVELQLEDDGYLVMANPTASASLCFSDLPVEEGEAWMKRFARHSAASFTNPLTYAGYKDLPVSYLLCADDKVIPAREQQKGIDMIERETGREVDVTVIQTGHFPIPSAPEKVVDWITSLASRYEKDQTVIVTGSNTGLGLEAARHFYRLNCSRLILAVRTVTKGQTAKEEIIGSEAHRLANFEINAPDLYAKLNEREAFSQQPRYQVTKLIEVLFTRELIARLKSKTASAPFVIINIVNPGFCFSNLDRSGSEPPQIVQIMRRILDRTTEVGGRTLVLAAAAPASSHGEFQSDGANHDVESWIYSDIGRRAQEKVFDQTTKVLEARKPGLAPGIGL